jgi:hypothetical protein
LAIFQADHVKSVWEFSVDRSARGITCPDAAIMSLQQASSQRRWLLALIWLCFVALCAGVSHLQQQLGVPDDAVVAGQLAFALQLIVYVW